MTKQVAMFQTEDLPLFSGTVQTVTIKPGPPRPEARQAILGNCRACMDYGWVDGKYCWCEAGQALRIWHRQTRKEKPRETL